LLEDRDPVGVAGQIGQHLLRPGERPLAIDEPLGPMQRREMIGLERGPFAGEVGRGSPKELQAGPASCAASSISSIRRRNSRDSTFTGKEVVWTAADPGACPSSDIPPPRHDHVDVWDDGSSRSPRCGVPR